MVGRATESMADKRPSPKQAPPPNVDPKAFKPTTLAPGKKGSAQMINQPREKR